ncbi:thioredoxin domain-containing protein, partial [Candidatus Micrarchaeota archaeon]|nr:thioredoxin domain-containing protein [Candidatus Micrarchaeota archaeon]
MNNKLLVIGAIIVLLSATTAAFILMNQDQTPPGITNLSYSILTGSNPVHGNSDSEIYIVEFTDYQCPYCSRHATTTVQNIKQEY